jgi:Rrf2 family protein
MIFSRRHLLALTAVIDIAMTGPSGPVSGAAIAARHGLPKRHLEPLLQILARHGILVGARGRNGGYQLAREAGLIRAADVLRAVKNKRILGQTGSPIVSAVEDLEAHSFTVLENVTVQMLASSVLTDASQRDEAPGV